MDWSYAGRFAIAYVVVLFGTFAVWAVVCGSLKGFAKRENGSTPNWPFIPLLLLLVVAPYVAYYGLGSAVGAYPLRSKRPVTEELAGLQQTAEDLRSRFSNPKQLTLEQLESALGETLRFAESTSRLVADQQGAIRDLAGQVDAEKKKAEEAQRLTAAIQALSRDQMSAVKLLITEDAREASRSSFLLGLGVSLPIGFL